MATKDDLVVLGRFGMVVSFLKAAKAIIGPVLQEVGGFRRTILDSSGAPMRPVYLDDKLRELSSAASERIPFEDKVRAAILKLRGEQLSRLSLAR